MRHKHKPSAFASALLLSFALTGCNNQQAGGSATNWKLIKPPRMHGTGGCYNPDENNPNYGTCEQSPSGSLTQE